MSRFRQWLRNDQGRPNRRSEILVALTGLPMLATVVVRHTVDDNGTRDAIILALVLVVFLLVIASLRLRRRQATR